jgi:hypothetical protein
MCVLEDVRMALEAAHLEEIQADMARLKSGLSASRGSRKSSGLFKFWED